MAKPKYPVQIIKLIFFCFLLLNFIGIFTPELGFDALWYHLTLPKLWLLKHRYYFPGGLLYYSAMPRLAETIFIPLIKYSGFIGPKAVQFLAGLTTCYLIKKITHKYTQSIFYSWLAVILFYATWIVSWQSSSSYIDLIRTSLETTALYFLTVYNKKPQNWILAGFFIGLAIGTKWLSLLSLFLYMLIFNTAILGPALLIASPWFYIAYRFTHNPIFPLFENFNIYAQLNQVEANYYSLTNIII